MIIQHKIRLFSLLMVLIPILITDAAIIICIKTSRGDYWYTLETMYKDENGIQSAQGLIYTYKKELWERDWETAVFDKNKEMNSLELELANMGYCILVKKNGEQLYSNILEDDMGTAQTVAGSTLDTAKMLAASRKSMSMIKYTFYRGDDSCSIVAVNNDHTDESMKSYLQSYTLRYIFIFVSLYFVLILLVNATLSWWISKSVLKPLEKLSFEANEIRDGNLGAGIDYDKEDEFGKVCQGFNEMREYLKQSVAQHMEYEERRKGLISGISHNLRTSLTPIRGYLDGLLEGVAIAPRMRKRYLTVAKIRTSGLEWLVDSLSEYNRLENSLCHCQMEQVDLKRYTESYLREDREETEKENVGIDFSCQNGVYRVLLDTDESKRVFDNLFINTIKYRIKRKSQVSIRLRWTDSGIMAELTLSDDGPGVPPESLGWIFENFYRADAVCTYAEEGNGIGLVVVKEIVSSHGSTIRVKNRNGLAMTIHIPLKGEDMDE